MQGGRRRADGHLHAALRLRRLDRRVEGDEAVQHRGEACKRSIIVDEEGERAFDLAERLRGLCHHAQLDLAEEIEGRGEDEGNDRAQLAIEASEGGELFAQLDHVDVIADDRGESFAEAHPLGRLAVQQRDLFAIFAQARQREAEIRLDPLAQENDARQRPADQVSDPRAGRGIDQRHPEQQAGESEIRARKSEMGGKAPQQYGEGDQRRQGRDQHDGIVVDAKSVCVAVRRAAVDEARDVLGNTLVGVVGNPAEEGHAIMRVPAHPMRNVEFRQPAPPADDEIGGDDIFDHQRGDIDEGPGHEHPEQKLPELRAVFRLDGVEEIAVEEIQPHGDRHFRLVDQDEKDHHAGRQIPLDGPEAERAVRGDGPVVGAEIAIGDAGHGAHPLEMRRGEDQDGENRHRQRQSRRKARPFPHFRPIAEARGEIAEAENNGLDREERQEDFQEPRKRRAAFAAIGDDQRRAGEQFDGRIVKPPADESGDKAKKRDSYSQKSHVSPSRSAVVTDRASAWPRRRRGRSARPAPQANRISAPGAGNR